MAISKKDGRLQLYLYIYIGIERDTHRYIHRHIAIYPSDSDGSSSMNTTDAENDIDIEVVYDSQEEEASADISVWYEPNVAEQSNTFLVQDSDRSLLGRELDSEIEVINSGFIPSNAEANPVNGQRGENTNAPHETAIHKNTSDYSSKNKDFNETEDMNLAGDFLLVEGSGRSFRKRTAIQKMPYSLERIKHKQLLQGYDVSSFDDVSNNVVLPQKAPSISLPVTKQNTDNDSTTKGSVDHIHDECDDGQFSDIQYESSEAEISVLSSDAEFDRIYPIHCDRIMYATKDGNQEDVSDHFEYHKDPESKNRYHENSNHKTEDDYVAANKISNEEIVFRGKKLNLSTAYRGVLPKMAWEKQLFSGSSPSYSNDLQRKRNLLQTLNDKGIAKKKKKSSIFSKQDSSLFDEMIVNDEDIDAQLPQNVEYGYFDIYQENPHQNNLKLVNDTKQLEKYYNTKYDRDCFSGDLDVGLSEGYKNKERNSTVHDSNQVDDEFYSQAAHFYEAVDIYTSSDENILSIETSAKEDRNGAIDYMLGNARGGGRKRKNRNTSRRGVRTPRILKKSIRNNSHRKVISRNKKSHTDGRRSGTTKSYNCIKNSDSSEGHESTDKKIRKISKYYSNRNDKTFLTVVEAIGAKFGTTSKKQPQRDNDPSHFNAKNDKAIQTRPVELPILRILTEKTYINPPDFINIKLSGKNFILSKLNVNELIENLQKVFDNIIEFGATDLTLFEISGTLTSFLYQLNIPNIRSTIEAFHEEFRRKVNTMANKAKPIHFFLIAVCQVMLLEVSRYSNVAASFQTNLETSILNHIISFFSLLSVCSESVLQEDNETMFESYLIIRVVVESLDGSRRIWDQLRGQQFRPWVAQRFCEIFPHSKPRWDMIKFKQTYDDMLSVIYFVKHCNASYNWKISDDMILKINTIFKRRRFSDFEEEQSLSTKNNIAGSPGKLKSFTTIFNEYLLLLQKSTISASLTEKITPMGDISKGDPISVLINRMNLLILLADRSMINFERRFDSLIKQVISSSYMHNLNTSDNKKIAKCILDTILVLIKNNSEKGLHLGGKAIPFVYKNLVISYECNQTLWFEFLHELRFVIKSDPNIQKTVLKRLFKCLEKMVKDSKLNNANKCLLEIYIENLQHLDNEWIQANLFRIIKGEVQNTIEFVDYYCAIGNFMVRKGTFSWWSFLMYNNLNGDSKIKFYFYQKLLESCDNNTFENSKKMMFDFLIDNLESYKDKYYIGFVQELLKRAGRFSLEIPAGQHIPDYLPFWKRIFKTLGNLKYSGFILKLVENINMQYSHNLIKIETAKSLIEFVDRTYVDILKNYQIFNNLKHSLGITDTETEKSTFRENFNSYDDNFDEQICFIIKSILFSSRDYNIEEKLLSLFQTVNMDKSRIYGVLASAMILSVIVSGKSEGSKLLKQLPTFLLYVINRANELFSFKFGDGEFLELLKLYHFICYYLPMDKLEAENKYLFAECIHFQYRLLSLTYGFIECRKLISLSKMFFNCSEQEVNPFHFFFSIEIRNKIHLIRNDIMTLDTFSAFDRMEEFSPNPEELKRNMLLLLL